MKYKIKLSILIFITFFFVSTALGKAPNSEQDKVSYSIGVDIGSNLKKQPYKIKVDQLIQGLKDSFGDKKLAISLEDAKEFIVKFQTEIREKKEEERKKMSEMAVQQGKEYLEKNKKRDGVKVTSSGLQYEVIKDGSGKTPGPQDKVKTHYKGTLISGKEFDSSYKRGQPATFRVNQVIKGWIEALQLMKVGAKWKLFIPPELAYGQRGAPPVIGPNETLVFEIELLGIES